MENVDSRIVDKSLLLNFKTMRKCQLCKEYVCIESDWDSILYSGKGAWHIECFRKDLLKKNKSKKSMNEIELLVNHIRDESQLILFNLVIKNHLYKYLAEHYRVILLPNYFFTKAEQIFTGEWKDMSRPIYPEHLLEMFIRQQGFLDRIYHKEKMDGTSRINYDLAVLISKYPKFLEWKEKTKIETKISMDRLEEEKSTLVPIKMNDKQEDDIFSDIGD
jgi:hypothetical protein